MAVLRSDGVYRALALFFAPVPRKSAMAHSAAAIAATMSRLY